MNPVVIIGAGPYGLSAAAHIRARGVPVRIFGSPMQTWRENMPVGMVLKSTPTASSISAPQRGHTLRDFCHAMGEEPLETDFQVVPIETFIRYGGWFAEMLVPDVEQVRVVSVDRTEGANHVKLDSGEEIRARAVVVATGLTGFAHLPRELAAAVPEGPSPSGPISHSSQHDNLTGFAGRRVIVVGAGQSALESAALLHEAGASVSVVVRGNSVSFGDPPTTGAHWKPNSPMGRAWSLYAFAQYTSFFRYLPADVRAYLVRNVLGPNGSWWLRERFVDQIPVRTRQQIIGAAVDGREVILRTRDQDGRTTELAADHLLAGTGYRVDLSALAYLGPGLRSVLDRTGGSPRLDAGLGSTVPGLHFTGLSAAATFGPLLRFVCGTRFASPTIADAIAGTR